MITRTSTADSYSALLAGLQAAQARQALAQRQASSGKLGADLKAYADHADTLTAGRAVQARTAAYIDGGQAVADKLSAQDLALTEVSSAADNARQAVLRALSTGDASGLMGDLQSALGQAADALNTDYQGRKLFGGGNDQVAPVSARTLADLTAAPSVDAVFHNDRQAGVSRLDDQTSVRTGVLAGDVGKPLLTALARLQAFNQGAPFTGKLTAAQTDFLQGAVAGLVSAHDAATAATAANGAVQNQVDGALSALKSRQTAATQVLGGLTDVDMAEVATRLQLAQVAVQASAQVFSTLQGSSLLKVLSP